MQGGSRVSISRNSGLKKNRLDQSAFGLAGSATLSRGRAKSRTFGSTNRRDLRLGGGAAPISTRANGPTFGRPQTNVAEPLQRTLEQDLRSSWYSGACRTPN